MPKCKAIQVFEVFKVAGHAKMQGEPNATICSGKKVLALPTG